IAVTGQYASVDGDLTGRENLRLFARLHRVRGPAARADELLERFGLTEAANRRSATYSGGMRRRLDLAASLVGRPEVLFLDEPTTGLDPAGRAGIWQAVRELAAQGTTVLLTTHDLQDIEQLCSRVMVIDHGRLMYDGPLAGLHEAGESERTLVVDLERELPPVEVPSARVVRVEGPRQWLAFPAGQSAAPVVARLAAEYPLVDLSVREPDIEAVIAKMYAEKAVS
ncbi:ATP-binding cassette domain-containing protein, partial [Streptomyces althioticus]|uniref:ATP-binding cassette domain-containing protein n=1 Tax=Streptomyces althioticus TaxID=83380 RepID=UPI0036917D07